MAASGRLSNFLAVILLCLLLQACSKPGQDALPQWKDGYLDIHHIATGRGNCTFMVMPDGTTMVVDAGDLGDSTQFAWDIVPALPNSTKRPAEWQAEYIRHFSTPLHNNGHIDYLLLTHFDMDHMGCDYPQAPSKNGYYLSGITHLGNILTIDKFVDRGDFESSRQSFVDNLNLFLSEKEQRDGLVHEVFEVGSSSQFRELHKPHDNFKITNIYASGKLFSNGEVTPIDAPAEAFNENRNSCTIKVSYGDFDYHISGDICEFVEEAVGDAEGECDGMLANHHSYTGAETEHFLSCLTPQVITIPSWDFYHPQPEELHRMLAASEECKVFSTGMVESNLERLGEDGHKMTAHGHIVVRVKPGGASFRVFALDAYDAENYRIIYSSPEIFSKKNTLY